MLHPGTHTFPGRKSLFAVLASGKTLLRAPRPWRRLPILGEDTDFYCLRDAGKRRAYCELRCRSLADLFASGVARWGDLGETYLFESLDRDWWTICEVKSRQVGRDGVGRGWNSRLSGGEELATALPPQSELDSRAFRFSAASMLPWLALCSIFICFSPLCARFPPLSNIEGAPKHRTPLVSS